ncbi:glucose 1-dehydrogenase [Acinetobacter indicus]|uniref:glucose 1-dehydrogenase n=1 Tax=Acinetobacter TaxID=469 RepID=UPI0002CDB223|nr:MULTISPECIES: glucose 1-dehydrogenase [Acinetobacter]ENW90954.1 2-hydroxycyclohexanecarboxyl-CoA dehydrogenase [Acinetobacter sp. CIP 53.82]MBA0156971.1 glucose 1-dehydrogenase [Acinetobacter indicus]MCO8107774.1 glucose 1-dehydrogenase [Acinetobacter indicus]MCP0916408.1 glucose 1-dehydrogenase [Acinetobacter indicus]MCP0919533.1 glucose 1-dehydrogenase [Acinetobacter indicus]
MKGLKDKVVIVTGGAGGIGSATCRRLAEEGAKVAIFDMNMTAAEQLAQEINQQNGQALAVQCDITNHNTVEQAVQQVESQLGPVDGLVNNAGWDIFKPFVKTNPQEWDKLIQINLVGMLNMHFAVLKGMVERNTGSIVNIASDAARVGSSGEAVYAACKGGLLSFSKTLAREHSRHNIKINVICPGPTDTALLAGVTEGASNPEKLREAFIRSIPLGRLGQPEDLASAIAFFLSEDASFITGQVLSVSGGLTMSG